MVWPDPEDAYDGWILVPDKKILTEMGKFNEELVKAGVLLAADGLHPSSKGARVRFGAKRNRD
jgi:hypothetical protein